MPSMMTPPTSTPSRNSRRAVRRRAALPAMVAVAALTVVLAAPAAVLADAPDGGWSATTKDLRIAIHEGDAERAKSLVDRLAATGEKRGYEVITRYALGGELYEVFSYAAGHLAKLEGADRSVVYEALESSKNYRSRIVLLAVLGRWMDDTKAVEALHGRIEDSRKEVIFTALRRIRDLDRPDTSLPSLIAALEKRERGPRDRVYFDLRDTLRDLTGRDFDIAADWKNYWHARQKGLTVPEKKKESGRTLVAKRPSFFSVSVDSDAIIFIIDISQSMLQEDPIPVGESSEPEVLGDGTTVVRLPRPKRAPDAEEVVMRSRISAVKDELIRTLTDLPEYVEFNIFSFNHEHSIFDASTGGGLVQAIPANKAKAVSWVKDLSASGATRTDLVLAEALQMPKVDTIYLLTDGAPKTIRNENIEHEVVFGLVRGYNMFRKARINTIGFVQAGPTMRRFVKELADQNDGDCILLE